uniref:Cell division cycle 2-like n=1 Tax=Ixodes scapularis TaxID=6945 RepID=Q4PM90_IXOSC|nr:cell division cycle 2-like [Ixodes scapularis]
MTRGNQRELARAKNAKKQQESTKKKGAHAEGRESGSYPGGEAAQGCRSDEAQTEEGVGKWGKCELEAAHSSSARRFHGQNAQKLGKASPAVRAGIQGPPAIGLQILF